MECTHYSLSTTLVLLQLYATVFDNFRKQPVAGNLAFPATNCMKTVAQHDVAGKMCPSDSPFSLKDHPQGSM